MEDLKKLKFKVYGKPHAATIKGVGGIKYMVYHKYTREESYIRKEIAKLFDNSEELSGLTYDEVMSVSNQIFELIVRVSSKAVEVSKQLEQERIDRIIRELAKKLDERDAQKK